MDTLIDKTIGAVQNILHLSGEKRYFRLEPTKPMSISEIHAVLEGLKKIDKNFEFRILWG